MTRKCIWGWMVWMLCQRESIDSLMLDELHEHTPFCAALDRWTRMVGRFLGGEPWTRAQLTTLTCLWVSFMVSIKITCAQNKSPCDLDDGFHRFSWQYHSFTSVLFLYFLISSRMKRILPEDSISRFQHIITGKSNLYDYPMWLASAVQTSIDRTRPKRCCIRINRCIPPLDCRN